MSFEARLENFPTLERLVERARNEGRYKRFRHVLASTPPDPCAICGATPVLHAMLSPMRLCRGCLAWAVS